MKQKRYFTAKEAAKELDISLATLYAYVSRGLIRSEDAGGNKRTRRYLREDVATLKARKEARRNPAKVLEDALHWGTPLLESAITLIVDESIYYRGQNVLTLLQTYSIEQVATLIWTETRPADPPPLFSDPWPKFSERFQTVHQAVTPLSLLERFQILLPVAAAEDLAAYDLRPLAVVQTGVRILRTLIRITAGEEMAINSTDSSIAQVLQQYWVADDSQAAPLLNAALILCADHELNVSAFTARCVASAGSPPYAVVMAGLAALQGVKHGGGTGRVEALFQEVKTLGNVRLALVNRLKRGETIPGFGHPLYPNGDPRAKALLDLMATSYQNSDTLLLATEIITETSNLIGEAATIDFALVTLTHLLNLPAGSAIALFALGRTVGWLGHALEQYQTNRLIRPRARYVGEQPSLNAS